MSNSTLHMFFRYSLQPSAQIPTLGGGAKVSHGERFRSICCYPRERDALSHLHDQLALSSYFPACVRVLGDHRRESRRVTHVSRTTEILFDETMMHASGGLDHVANAATLPVFRDDASFEESSSRGSDSAR